MSKTYQPICTSTQNPLKTDCCDPTLYYCPSQSDPTGGAPNNGGGIGSWSTSTWLWIILAFIVFIIIVVVVIGVIVWLVKSKNNSGDQVAPSYQNNYTPQQSSNWPAMPQSNPNMGYSYGAPTQFGNTSNTGSIG